MWLWLWPSRFLVSAGRILVLFDTRGQATRCEMFLEKSPTPNIGVCRGCVLFWRFHLQTVRASTGPVTSVSQPFLPPIGSKHEHRSIFDGSTYGVRYGLCYMGISFGMMMSFSGCRAGSLLVMRGQYSLTRPTTASRGNPYAYIPFTSSFICKASQITMLQRRYKISSMKHTMHK